MFRQGFLSGAGASLLVACAVAQPAADAGNETAACIEGSCFGDLECLSDLCVAPDGGSDGETGGVASDGSQSGSGQSGDASASASGMSGSAGDETGNATNGDDTNGDDTNGDTAPTSGCQKIDYLIVVDDSASTSTFQSALVTALPDLVAGIKSVSSDYHIGVVTTDAYLPNAPECAELGGLVVQTGGSQSSNAACGPYAGGNFMTADDNLGQSLACAARVGTSGDGNERPLQALLTATGGNLACNTGFLRPDSLLVVILVTDEYDGPLDPEGTGSPGNAETWYADLLAHRGTAETNAVVGVLTNFEGGACPPADANYDGAEMVTFAEKFTYGIVGGICEPFTPFFLDVNDAVGAACDNFEG